MDAQTIEGLVECVFGKISPGCPKDEFARLVRLLLDGLAENDARSACEAILQRLDRMETEAKAKTERNISEFIETATLDPMLGEFCDTCGAGEYLGLTRTFKEIEEYREIVRRLIPAT